MKKNNEGINTASQKTRQIGLRFFSNASIYALGLAAVKVGTLILLPIYWQVLTPTDFGLIAISQIIIQFLSSVLDLGISGSIQRHYFEWKPEDRNKHLAALWSFSFAFSLVLCLILTLATPIISPMFETQGHIDLLYFGIWIAFFQSFGILPFALTRIKEQLSLFSLFSIGQFLIQSVGILVCIFILKMGYLGFLVGTLAGSIFYAFASVLYNFSQTRFPFHWGHLKEPLAYALPTAPAGILEGLGFVLDRFFLQGFIGLEQLGIYSLARQFGMAYNFFVSTLKSSWVPLVYRMVAEREDASKVLSRLSTYYFLILTSSALAVSVMASEVVLWIGKTEYYAVSPYIPYFVLCYVLYGIGNIYGRGLDLAKKTQYYWIVYAVNFVVNLVLVWSWAPIYGAWGAIAALLTAGLCREATLIGLAHYFYPRKVDLISILKIIFPHVAAYAIIVYFPQSNLWVSTLFKLVLISAAGLLSAFFVFGRPGFVTALNYAQRKLKIF